MEVFGFHVHDLDIDCEFAVSYAWAKSAGPLQYHLIRA